MANRTFSASVGWVFTSFFLVFVAPLAAQESLNTYKVLWQMPMPANVEQVVADKMQQLYILTPSNELIKYDAQGRELFRYNNNTLGPVGSVIVNDPLQVLLFYPNFQRLLVLDRTLNILTEIPLDPLRFTQVTQVGLSRDNTLWLYDAGTYRLVQLSRSGEVLRESPDLRLLLPNTPQISQLAIAATRIFLLDAEQGVLEFDALGQWVRSRPLPEVTGIQVMEKYLLLTRSDAYALMDEWGRETPLPILPTGIEPLAWLPGRVYGRRNDMLVALAWE
ncbi:MAG: hypothetical protein H6555_11640 [Lewinellaceae bacterium]|nr:hypothetical protein [Lewinellaceae bacterium]